MPILTVRTDEASTPSKYTPSISSGPTNDFTGVPDDVQDKLTRSIFNQATASNVGVSGTEMAARWLAGTAVDLGDTVAAAVPGIDRGDVWSMFDGTEQKAFYERNKGLVEGSSALVGMVATGYLGSALVLPRIGTALANSTYLTTTRLWQAGARYNEATREGMLMAQRIAAAEGRAYHITRSAAGLKYLGLEIAKGVGVGTAEEALMFGVMHANDAAYSNDLSRELFWAMLGPGIGGTVFGVSARAYSRQFANSREIRDIRASTLDPAGASNALVAPVLDRSLSETGQVTLKESARLTEYLVGSRMKALDDSPTSITGRLDDLRAQFSSHVDTSLQKINSRGIPGVPTVGGKISSIPEFRQLRNLAKDDPFMFHGMDSMGVAKVPLKEVNEGRKTYIESIRKEADMFETKKGLPRKARELRELAAAYEKQQQFVLIGGKWQEAASKEVESLINFKPENVKMEFSSETSGVKITDGQGNPTWIDESFHLNKRKRFNELEIKDRLKILEASRRVFSRMLQAKKVHVIPADVVKRGDWFALDMAMEYKRRGGTVNLQKAGFTDDFDVLLTSLQLKARDILAKKGKEGINEWDRFAYNLPGGTTFERMEDSGSDLLKAWLAAAAGADKSKKAPSLIVKELEEALQVGRAVAGFDLMPKGGGSKIMTYGDMFNWNRNAKGEWLRPMIGYFDEAESIQPLTKAGVTEANALRKITVINELRSAGKNAYTSQVLGAILEMPESRKAMDIMGLADDQVTGLGGGVGQLLGEGLTRRMRYRDNETMLAATRVQEIVTRLSNAKLEELMTKHGMTKALNLVGQSNRRHQKVMLDQWFSNRGGWDLVEEPVPVGKDRFGFELADTPKNRNRLNVEEVEEGTLLVNPRNGNVIALDGETLGIVEQFTKMADDIRLSDNALRKARGLKEINRMPWFVPAPNTKGMRIAFVFDDQQNLLPGRTIVEKTDDSFNARYAATERDLVEEFGEGHGYTIREKSSLESMRDIWDQAEMDWIDPHFTGRPDKGQAGGLTQAFVSDHAFSDALDWVRRKTIAQGNDVIRTVFDEPIQVARAFAATERNASGGSTLAKTNRSIWDEYEASLTGKSLAYMESSITGSVLSAAEKKVDQILAATNVRFPARWVTDLATRIGLPHSRLNKANSFKELSKELGKFIPYKSVTDYIEQTTDVRRPLEVRAISEKVNQFAAAIMLRWFELPHAALNMIGVVATMPALIRSGRAPITAGFNLSDGTKVGAVDAMRIMTDSMKDMWSGRRGADWDHMVKMGDASQQVADFNRAMGTIQNQSTWRQIMFGTGAKSDPAYKRIGIDGLVSIATDTTENWSRQWAHFAGLRLADYHGITGMGARHDFAREIANAVIADYAPINRPELFQTGFGSMFGLFMSYMMNQNMKMFRWMEQKDWSAMGIQMAMQASLFGVTGVAGVKQLMATRDYLEETGSKEPTALDRLYAQFGPVAGQMIAHGGLTLTGLAFYTRGDMSVRMPASLDPISMAPGATILAGVSKAVLQGMQQGLSILDPGTGQQMMEMIIREMPNRVMKGWLTVLANGGQETDHYGNIMAETRTWTDTAARMIGLRSSRQQAEINQYYASKSAAEKDAARMETLRGKLRSNIRSIEGTNETLNVVKYFNDYVKAGGNPRQFKTWLKGIMRDATSTRAVNAVKKSLRNPNSQLEAWRFGAYGANVD